MFVGNLVLAQSHSFLNIYLHCKHTYSSIQIDATFYVQFTMPSRHNEIHHFITYTVLPMH